MTSCVAFAIRVLSVSAHKSWLACLVFWSRQSQMVIWKQFALHDGKSWRYNIEITLLHNLRVCTIKVICEWRWCAWHEAPLCAETLSQRQICSFRKISIRWNGKKSTEKCYHKVLNGVLGWVNMLCHNSIDKFHTNDIRKFSEHSNSRDYSDVSRKSTAKQLIFASGIRIMHQSSVSSEVSRKSCGAITYGSNWAYDWIHLWRVKLVQRTAFSIHDQSTFFYWFL